MSRLEIHSSHELPATERKIVADIGLALIAMHEAGVDKPGELPRPADVARQLIGALAACTPDSKIDDIYKDLIIAITALMLGDGGIIQTPAPPTQSMH